MECPAKSSVTLTTTKLALYDGPYDILPPCPSCQPDLPSIAILQSDSPQRYQPDSSEPILVDPHNHHHCPLSHHRLVVFTLLL
jgi:hypothetical protein